MTTKKLDKTDLEQLTTLQDAYQQVTQQIANCTIDESMLTERLQEIQQEKQAKIKRQRLCADVLCKVPPEKIVDYYMNRTGVVIF